MLTSSFVFGISVVHNAAGYIASRLLIGIALAGFVTCQFWASMMFSPNVVGIANAIAGGWGNAGEQALSCYIVADVDIHRHARLGGGSPSASSHAAFGAQVVV